MGKLLLVVVLVLSVMQIGANSFENIKKCEGELRVADTLNGNDLAIRNLALEVGISNPKLKISIDKKSEKEALELLGRGEVDIVLVNDIDSKGKYIAQPYALEVALVIVNIKNSKNDFSIAELKAIYTSKINNWSTLNGSNYTLHRMGVNSTSSGATVFERIVLGGEAISETVYRKDSLAELLILAAANANTIAFIGYPDLLLGSAIREVAIEGVTPTPANIRSGKYPLVGRRYAIIGDKVNFQTRTFMQLLQSNEFKAMVKEADLMPLN